MEQEREEAGSSGNSRGKVEVHRGREADGGRKIEISGKGRNRKSRK